jgi:arylsulfatase
VVPYREDGELVTLPDDFYSTEFYTDKAIAYIDESLQNSGRPFFGYVAYTAPHWPLQVDSSYSDKYRGRYAAGYEALKAERLERMIAQGIVKPDVRPYPGSGCNIGWDELSDEERIRQARLMEVYAGMVDALDENIGRLIAHLKALGEYENTLIVFMSDNGADARPERGLGGESKFIKEHFDNSLENIGRGNSFVSYGAAWAEVGSIPFRLFKGMTTEGGIRVPAIVRLPGNVNDRGSIKDQFLSVLDIMPTFLETAGVEHPGSSYKGRDVFPAVWKSFLPYLNGVSDSVHADDPYGFSVHRRQGLQVNEWKVVRLPKPYGDYNWELYNLDADPGETTNLAALQPDVLSRMVARWDAFALSTGVIVSEESTRTPRECRAGS